MFIEFEFVNLKSLARGGHFGKTGGIVEPAMSGPPRVRSTNVVVTAGDREVRSVLGPCGNKAPPKAAKKPEKVRKETEGKGKDAPSSRKPNPVPQSPTLSPSMLNFSSMNVSFLSDGASSSDSSSSGRGLVRRSGEMTRRKRCVVKPCKTESQPTVEKSESRLKVERSETDCLDGKKRCAWITPNTDSCYVAFHDEEWGVPVHEDRKLFELLSLTGALAELTWPAILNKRHVFRETFLDFDPTAVGKLNEKKIVAPGGIASSLLSESKIRGIIENARQICKVAAEFGSFDRYIWNFVIHKPVVGQFRYHRQVPVKTSKAELISKDLVRRGFRSVGPTVICTFMQVAGLANDHLISCFRFQECLMGGSGKHDEALMGGEDLKQLQFIRTL